jgi:hypothetical protein
MARATSLTPAPTQTIVADETVFDAGPLVMRADFDQIELLPTAAADRLRMLRQHVADLHQVIPEFSLLQEANLAKITADRELQRLLASAHDDGFNLEPNDHRAVAARRRADKAEAEVKRLTELREVRSASWAVASTTLRNMEGWLASGRPPGTMLEDYIGEPPKLNKNEDILSALERVRRRGRELQADRHRIQSAPLPSAHAKRKMREWVEVLAQRGAPNVSGLIEHLDGKIEFQRQLARATVHNVPKAPAAVAYTELVDPVALVAWLLKDALIKRLDAEIDAESDDAASLLPEAREKAEAEILSDILANDRAESFFVALAQSQNLPVEHRSEINPLALLGLRLVTAPRAVPSLGSSPEHAFGLVGR